MTERILMGHGSGGKMMHRLIRDLLAPAFEMGSLGDAALLDLPQGQTAVTTDETLVDAVRERRER